LRALRSINNEMFGPPRQTAAWFDDHAKACGSYLFPRFAGDHERYLEMLASIRALGW
jgi:hypothetical protein